MAIDTRRVPSQPLTARTAPPGRARHRAHALSQLRIRNPHAVVLCFILIATLLLRLWGIKQGLPYSYNVDEATHFVPRAVAFFSQDLNPHYFLNPPAYSYLLHIVFELWFGSGDAVSRAYASNPTDVYVVARVVAAVLGTASVWLTYLAGARFFNKNVGLAAAAIFGFAFLPIFYSHLALNDVPTLAPVALSLYGTACVLRRGRLRDYVIAGIGLGLAAATKYTGGIALLCLLAAFVSDGAGGAFWVALRRLAIGLIVAFIAFVIANPYSLLDFHAFTSGVSSQASLAAGQDPVKLGTRPGSGIDYYLWTFTWGLGWGPVLAAIGGAVLLLARRRWALAMVLIPAPITFIIFMGNQQRYFGRWLMPIFPIVAILGAYGAIELIGWLIRARRIPAPAAVALVTVLLLAQSLVAVLHDDAVLSRPDTRNLVRAWMVNHVPAGAKVVIEPVVSDNWATDVGVSLPWTPTGDRWYRYPTWLTDLDPNGNPLAPGQRRYVLVDQYERTLRPALLDQYAGSGYCWIVIGSEQAGRAFAQPQLVPSAIAYYAALANRARLVYHVSPFSPGTHPVPFSFDWAIDYYPRQYRRPGPELSVYRLSGGKCGAA
ncbi:MAG TPA: glycosyltransferase family 39 protein [Solirubrobacteraceae bacterium]|nr:glycosyltransferase family 39 protein [Solirubrobacteraceae bacterium]